MINNTLGEITEKLKSAKCVAIFCHVRPDGDALGSGLALRLALENAGKTAVMCCEDKPPEKFFFLSEMTNVLRELPAYNYDLLVSVDCADITRLGSFAKFYSKFKKETINIDHHISNNGYGKLNYIQECPASCEIVTGILNECGFEITEDIADLLMLGMITDSGNFTHLDVTENTFKTAGYLRSKGADCNKINYNVNVRQPKSRALLYGRVMSKMRFDLEGKLAFAVITQKDMQELGADKDLTEGFVDFPLTVDGVEVAVSLLEYKKNKYKVSLRSKGKANVNAVATTFGGGGHILASGCMLFGELEEVVERLTRAVSLNL